MVALWKALTAFAGTIAGFTGSSFSWLSHGFGWIGRVIASSKLALTLLYVTVIATCYFAFRPLIDVVTDYLSDMFGFDDVFSLGFFDRYVTLQTLDDFFIDLLDLFIVSRIALSAVFGKRLLIGFVRAISGGTK